MCFNGGRSVTVAQAIVARLVGGQNSSVTPIFMTEHYLYKITNKINGHIYIGAHSTKKLNDNYFGSGKYLKHAIDKYGIDNFIKEVIQSFNTKEEMYVAEKEIVNQDFIDRKDTYNIKLGGEGGWDHENQNSDVQRRKGLKGQARIKELLKTDPEFLNRRKENGSKILKRLHKEGIIHHCDWTGKHHTEETKKKIGLKNSISLLGEKNGMFGKIWIHNIEKKQSILIKIEQLNDYLNDGWIKGRKKKF